MTEIEIRQNNGNQISIRADSEDSGLFYNGLFKMLSMPVEDFRDEHNTVDVETKEPEPEPVEAKEPEPEPVEAKKPELKPVEAKKPELKPVEAKKPELKPVETKEPELKPVEAKKPETKPAETKKLELKPVEAKKPELKPVEAKEPELKPVEAKEPELKPVEAKKPGTKAAEPQEPQDDGLPDIPEGVDPLEPPAEEIAEWSISDITQRLRSMTDDVYDIAGDPARRKLKERIEEILKTKYKVRTLPSVPRDEWGKAYADVKRTYLILKEELINQNAAN